MIGRRRAVRRVHIARHGKDGVERTRDQLAVEEPLEIRVSRVGSDGDRVADALAVTMRTPGDDFELVAGFLHGEGIVSGPGALHEMTYCRSGDVQEYNVVMAHLAPGVSFDAEALRRNVFMSSSCGVCGKASLDAVEARGCRALEDDVTVAADMLSSLPGRLREGQGVFARTGGLHAAGLFTAGGECVVVREDVGRHNAVDKAVGHLFLRRALPAAGRILVVSGRASFEILQKAVAAGVPVVMAVGAPSSLAVEMAARFGVTLVGFARGGAFNVYAGDGRVH